MASQTKAVVKELSTRVSDLEEALKAIGRIMADGSVAYKSRADQVLGVLKMYHCEPATTKEAE